jgi:serine/threonine protein kinase
MFQYSRDGGQTNSLRFYAAEFCLVLKYLHGNGILYRSVNLNNIMLGSDGHIKVVDFGLCKENMWFGSTTGTFCGTAEFMAPEVLYLKDHFSSLVYLFTN